MIVRVIPDQVAVTNDLFEPSDVGLLENTTYCEEVHQAAIVSYEIGRADRVALCAIVEQTFGVVPLSVFPGWEVPAHFEIERDGDSGDWRRPCSSQKRRSYEFSPSHVEALNSTSSAQLHRPHR